MSNAFTYIHYIDLSHVTKRNNGWALGTRTISGYVDTIMERQKRESLEAAIQSRIIDMRTIKVKLRIFDIKEELSTLTVTAFVKECYNK